MTSLLAERLSAQLLAGRPAGTVLEVVERLLAVQAQDPRGFRLAIRPRSSGLSSSDVDRALTKDRSVVVATLNRGTLHLVGVEDYWWLHALTNPQLQRGNARRLAEEGVSPSDADRGVAIIEKALATNAPMTASALRESVALARIRAEGQALMHILLLAMIRGLIVRGPMLGSTQAVVLVRDWLGRPPRPMVRDAALGELARRYLAGHGPADAADLAKWAGISLGEARKAFAGSAELTTREDGLVDLVNRRITPALPPPRLLGSFDPSLHGWTSREQIVGSNRGVVTNNGIFRPFAMVNGKAVATWTLTKNDLALRPFKPISRTIRKSLDREADGVIQFLAT